MKLSFQTNLLPQAANKCAVYQILTKKSKVIEYNDHSHMKKIIWLVLIFLSVFFLSLRFLGPLILSQFNLQAKAGIRVMSTPENATVFLDGTERGKTPFEETSLNPGEYLVKLNQGETSWQGRVRLNSGTLSVVNRELSKELISSSGEILTLESGQGVTIISSPSSAQLEIDGKLIGKTPINVEVVEGDHTFVLSLDNYLKRSIRAYVPKKYSLNLNVDLALAPTLATESPTPTIMAKKTLLVVKETPTGFLRVRDRPSLSGLEIARVAPGNELELIEEGPQWTKIKTAQGLEGYVSTTYVEKKP